MSTYTINTDQFDTELTEMLRVATQHNGEDTGLGSGEDSPLRLTARAIALLQPFKLPQEQQITLKALLREQVVAAIVEEEKKIAARPHFLHHPLAGFAHHDTTHEEFTQFRDEVTDRIWDAATQLLVEHSEQQTAEALPAISMAARYAGGAKNGAAERGA